MVIDCLPFMGHIIELSVRGSPNGTIGNFTNGTIGSQWLTYGTIGLPLAPIIVPLGESMVPLALPITIGTIGKTLKDIDIGITLVPLGNPEHTPYFYTKWLSTTKYFSI